MAIQPIELHKTHRLFGPGPTTLVSAKADGEEGVMAAAWVVPFEFDKLVLILDSGSYTRGLIERSGYFAVQVPTVRQAELVLQLGSESKADNPDKLRETSLFYQEGYDVPLVEGAAGWVICRLIGDEANRERYDLLMGQVVAAWSDDRILRDGHWQIDEVPEELRTLHYVAGGQFYVFGKGLKFDKMLALEEE